VSSAAPVEVSATVGEGAERRPLPYRAVWVVDFEFVALDGEHPDPVCMVALELRTGKTLRLWRDELHRNSSAPIEFDEDTLFVAYYASAELSCFLALGWSFPRQILDLFVEFRAMTNGLKVPHGNGLLGAMAYFGLSAMGMGAKDDMRALIRSGGPWNSSQRADILNYCEQDVRTTAVLLQSIVPKLLPGAENCEWLNLGQALLRGRYMAAVARMEHTGVPIDVPIFERLTRNWLLIQASLIEEVDQSYGVYDGRTFKAARFEAWLRERGIPWPRLQSGALALDDDTFRQMARAHPAVAPLRELRHTVGQLRLLKLWVGADGRNRCMLSPFRSKTGRNQPSNAAFIFGPSRWLRGLIKPRLGYGLAYLDFSSQEIAIAAALSGDEAMKMAYESGDPYLAFAIQAGLAPAGATKSTHSNIRNRCKAIVLGVGYGMGAESMAYRAGLTIPEARELLQRHRDAYRVFWRWAEGNVNVALAGGILHSQFGWPIRCTPGERANPRSLLNFPMQANGAEMLRLAACMATEAGLSVCAPIHDALLLEARDDRLDEDVARLKAIMQEASRVVMGGLTCRVDADIVRYPARYHDEAGVEMWDRVIRLLDKAEFA
jgi:DNA polymerase I